MSAALSIRWRFAPESDTVMVLLPVSLLSLCQVSTTLVATKTVLWDAQYKLAIAQCSNGRSVVESITVHSSAALAAVSSGLPVAQSS